MNLEIADAVFSVSYKISNKGTIFLWIMKNVFRCCILFRTNLPSWYSLCHSIFIHYILYPRNYLSVLLSVDPFGILCMQAFVFYILSRFTVHTSKNFPFITCSDINYLYNKLCLILYKYLTSSGISIQYSF